MQLRLVLLDGHHVVRLRFDDRPGRLDLRVHGVQRDDGSFEFEQLQQHGHGGISFGFSSTDSCRNTSRVSVAKAVIVCSGDWSAARSNEPFSVFPSIAIPGPVAIQQALVNPLMHGGEELARVEPRKHTTEQ
ncbi:MAG: hypothetical protein R3B91_01165 [Planctomycetaceae bacterium]